MSLRRLYEAINGVEYDRRNFAKAAATGLLCKDTSMPSPGTGRKLNLYSVDEDACDVMIKKNKRNPFNF